MSSLPAENMEMATMSTPCRRSVGQGFPVDRALRFESGTLAPIFEGGEPRAAGSLRAMIRPRSTNQVGWVPCL
jgi:hypothetical protein